MTTGEIANGRSIAALSSRLPAELLADQHHRSNHAEDRVQGHCDADADNGQPEGVQAVRAGDRIDRLAEAVLEGPVEDHRHGDDQQRRQVDQRDGPEPPA